MGERKLCGMAEGVIFYGILCVMDEGDVRNGGGGHG